MTWPRTSVAELSDWCRRHLSSPVDNVLFETGFASQVFGLRLADGQEVVVKVRAFSPRIPAAVMVQRQLCCAGFPCPRPLTDLMPLGEQWISAESLVLGGAPLRADHAEAPELYAAALAELIRLAPAPDTLPTLLPPPDHAHWNHAETGVWPRRDAVGEGRDTDLNRESDPVWLRQTATLVRLRLAKFKGPDVVGHARDAAALGTLEQVLQQRCLANAGLAAQHQHSAAFLCASGLQKLVKDRPLALASSKRGPRTNVGHSPNSRFYGAQFDIRSI